MSSLAVRSEVNEKDAPLPAISRTTTAPADSLDGRLANPLDKSRDISVEEWHERVVAALNDQSRPLPRVW
jgi:hypothetical protein